MLFVYFLCLFTMFFAVQCRSSDKDQFDFMNIHCRDNYDIPVDWWFIYKPPSHTGPYFESGGNFTYLLPSSKGRLKPSHKSISSDSMLQFTLAPLYEKIYKGRLAIMSYGEPVHFEEDVLLSQKSVAFGLMIANSEGGIWIGHTIPGFPNLTKRNHIFPEEELKRGHMLVCVNVNLPILNAITGIVRHTDPNIIKFTLPDNLMIALPEWTLIETAASLDEYKEPQTKLLQFRTKGNSMQVVMVARSPEDPRCLYKTFARLKGVVMDVYSNTAYKQRPYCEKSYSLRHIDSISLKFLDQKTYYIENKTDWASFAVSTAAVWQRRGQKSPQYWTCAGNIDHQSAIPAKGGLIACFNHYLIWTAFDNLKVKEPSCA